MPFERPSKGNPHELTIRQHIFPARSISRYCDNRGLVQVFDKLNSKTYPSSPKNPIFCAPRVWHHGAEQGYMREIENTFQPIAEAIVRGSLRHLSSWDAWHVTKMYSLWVARYLWRGHDQPDPVLNVAGPERNRNQVQQEALERAGVLFIRPDSTFPIRQLVGVKLHQQLDDLADGLHGRGWGIIRAGQGEFIVPDNFANLPILPLSPSIMLLYGEENAVLGPGDVTGVNYAAIAAADRYVFARDWDYIELAQSGMTAPSKSRRRPILSPGPFWSSGDRTHS